MSDVTTNPTVVNSGVQEQAAEQVAQAAQLSAEQQAEVLAEAKKELGLVVKALRSGKRENAVSQYLAGLHGLRFINLCRKAGKARAFATGELERDLSWWLGKNVDANLILRAYASINLLHGDIMPPPSGAKAKERNEWAELVDRLPPIGHFHKAWAQLVERVDDGIEERWVLLPGFEEKCTALYQEVLNKGVKLEDQTDAGTIVEKGILTRTREFMVEYMRFKADKKAAEAAAKSEAKEELEEQAKGFEDKAQAQQKVVKSLLEQSQQAKPENKAKLQRILTYHVVAGRVSAADVMKMKTAKAVSGDTLTIAARSGGVMIDNAHVAKADIAASNGIIHVIDAVVIPKDQ